MLRKMISVAKFPLESNEVDVRGDHVPQPAGHPGESDGDPGAAGLVIVSRRGNVDQLGRHGDILEQWQSW